jgi:hypothetical protein
MDRCDIRRLVGAASGAIQLEKFAVESFIKGDRQRWSLDLLAGQVANHLGPSGLGCGGKSCGEGRPRSASTSSR